MKTLRIEIRVTEEQKSLLKKLAGSMSITDYILKRCLDAE